jgi:hypothetical protein
MKRILVAALGIGLWCTAANAATIVQTVSGNQVYPDTINLFIPDPLLLQQLVSVQIEGTMSVSEGVIRANPLDLSELSYSQFGTGFLELSSGGGHFVSSSLTGTEFYPEGSIGGSISLSGPIFAILTGPAMDPFRAPPISDSIMPDLNMGPPLGGALTRGGLISYAVTITYTILPVPEPSTWAMMLLGFGAIGMAVRRRKASTLAEVECPL